MATGSPHLNSECVSAHAQEVSAVVFPWLHTVGSNCESSVSHGGAESSDLRLLQDGSRPAAPIQQPRLFPWLRVGNTTPDLHNIKTSI